MPLYKKILKFFHFRYYFCCFCSQKHRKSWKSSINVTVCKLQIALPNHNMIFSCIFNPSTNTGLERVNVDLFWKFYCIFLDTKEQAPTRFQSVLIWVSKTKGTNFFTVDALWVTHYSLLFHISTHVIVSDRIFRCYYNSLRIFLIIFCNRIPSFSPRR